MLLLDKALWCKDIRFGGLAVVRFVRIVRSTVRRLQFERFGRSLNQTIVELSAEHTPLQ